MCPVLPQGRNPPDGGNLRSPIGPMARSIALGRRLNRLGSWPDWRSAAGWQVPEQTDFRARELVWCRTVILGPPLPVGAGRL